MPFKGTSWGNRSRWTGGASLISLRAEGTQHPQATAHLLKDGAQPTLGFLFDPHALYKSSFACLALCKGAGE